MKCERSIIIRSLIISLERCIRGNVITWIIIHWCFRKKFSERPWSSGFWIMRPASANNTFVDFVSWEYRRVCLFMQLVQGILRGSDWQSSPEKEYSIPKRLHRLELSPFRIAISITPGEFLFAVTKELLRQLLAIYRNCLTRFPISSCSREGLKHSLVIIHWSTDDNKSYMWIIDTRC